ncbi:FAD-binding oxidoreductase [uncultured Litoreibacter sp.]|uniref:FAD-binding oxidoreductase n=1 Tax=uncultured Litoreibacter sp. TaxID=1392394 RepID=UPI002622F267|nr:FAD-binding oxidoreductase [uncultured Litoreibacter sp.]
MQLLETLKRVVGDAHVLTGDDAAPFGKDWTGKYISTPLAVVRPATTQEVSAVVKTCSVADVPIVPVSGNTGLSGGAYAEGAIMISLSRMNAIREIRPDARVAIVDAGVVLSSLHEAVDAHDLVFPLFFGARGSAMIGGVLSTNAGGSNVLRYGNTRALCLGLEVVLPDGRIMDLMSELHKDNTGYDLKHLMIGAEGTLGLITAAVLKLSPKPLAYATAMVATPDLPGALSLLNQLQSATGGAVEAFEYMPRAYVERHIARIPGAREPFDAPYDVNILVEVGATAPRDADVQPDGSVPVTNYLEEVLSGMLEDGTVLDAVVAKSDGQRAQMWERRESAAEVTLTTPTLVDNDVSVPVDKVGTFLDRITERVQKLDPGAAELTVSHLGDGNLHYTVFPNQTDAEHRDLIRQQVEEVTRELGGSFSAEHGIGLTKLPSMTRNKDAVSMDVMRLIKAALDPKGIMNPGKVIPKV